MAFIVVHVSSTNSEAETVRSAVVNIPLMKKKINMKGINLFMLNTIDTRNFLYKIVFVNWAVSQKIVRVASGFTLEFFYGMYRLVKIIAER